MVRALLLVLQMLNKHSYRLNEGFATFVGNQAVDYLFPHWNIWTQFVSFPLTFLLSY